MLFIDDGQISEQQTSPKRFQRVNQKVCALHEHFKSIKHISSWVIFNPITTKSMFIDFFTLCDCSWLVSSLWATEGQQPDVRFLTGTRGTRL